MVAQTYNISRQTQDAYALTSHTRAASALARGLFQHEILPVEIRGQTISVDDTIRAGVTLDSLAALRPAFPDWGAASTTAGNASGVGDGAGLVVMMRRDRAESEGFPVVGKWVGSAVVGVEPRVMGIAPVAAVPKMLERVGLNKGEVDVYEVSSVQLQHWLEQMLQYLFVLILHEPDTQRTLT